MRNREKIIQLFTRYRPSRRDGLLSVTVTRRTSVSCHKREKIFDIQLPTGPQKILFEKAKKSRAFRPFVFRWL